jgi:hypothetical protein
MLIEQVGEGQKWQSMSGSSPSVWTGRALQAKNEDPEMIGLALLYPVRSRKSCSATAKTDSEQSRKSLGSTERSELNQSGKSCGVSAKSKKFSEGLISGTLIG